MAQKYLSYVDWWMLASIIHRETRERATFNTEAWDTYNISKSPCNTDRWVYKPVKKNSRMLAKWEIGNLPT